jgi:uncharacterized protein YjlB
MGKGKPETALGGDLIAPPQVITHFLDDNGDIPNSDFPLLIYQQAFHLVDDDSAAAIERVVKSNEWGGTWRNGVFTYHHYHSTAHELLAVYSGSATIQFGGDRGITTSLERGDVVVIPAGVGHKNLGSALNFAVVGAYPKGQTWDICYGKPDERPRADDNIARVPLPEADPIYGADGPLIRLWKS